MVTTRGKAEVKRVIADTPRKLENVLRGAAKAGGTLIADEIKNSTPSHEVREGVRVRSQKTDGGARVAIDVKPGWARSVGIWLEYGTSEHVIRVDESQRDGRTVKRINQLAKQGSLVIGGHFVGASVVHPGARPHPTFRPALDMKEGEAIAAAQAYINSRVGPAGITAGPADGGAE